jgi:hypothetical protein
MAARQLCGSGRSTVAAIAKPLAAAAPRSTATSWACRSIPADRSTPIGVQPSLQVVAARTWPARIGVAEGGGILPRGEAAE